MSSPAGLALFGQIYHLADNGSIVAFCIRCYATDGVFIPIDCQQLIYRILKFRYSVATRLLIMLRSEYSSGLLKSPMNILSTNGALVVVGYFQQQNGIFFEACEVDGNHSEFCAIVPCVAVDAYFGKRSDTSSTVYVSLMMKGATGTPF